MGINRLCQLGPVNEDLQDLNYLHYVLSGYNGTCTHTTISSMVTMPVHSWVDTFLVVSSVLLNLTHNNVISDHFTKLEWDQSTGMTTIQALCTIHAYRTYAHTVSTYNTTVHTYVHKYTLVLCASPQLCVVIIVQ